MRLQTGTAEPCELLDWDTSFWGFCTSRVRGDSLTPERLAGIEAWCAQRGVRCLYFLARSEDPSTTRLAEDSGFRLVDVRMTLEHKASSLAEARIKHPDPPVPVRLSRPEDLPTLEAIARVSYLDTRFYFDPNFPRPLCGALYETWIRRSCEGYANAVLVAELEGQPVGYISCHLDGELPVGRIGLLGVSDRARGRGVGQTLVLRALEWFAAQGAQRTTVVTQGRNVAAQRLYQSCGFRTQTVQLWYHKWYHPGR